MEPGFKKEIVKVKGQPSLFWKASKHNFTICLIEAYISARKAERGLTAKGEKWIRQTLPKFQTYVGEKRISAVNREDVREFLSCVNGVWNRHSHFRAIRAFFNWLENEGYIKLSPCYKMQAPKLPKLVLPRPSLVEVKELIERADNPRDKAVISLLINTGFRLCEIANIKLEDINLKKQTVKVCGKGARERIGKFGNTTATYLKQHLATFSPNENIWGINYWGINIMLRRLEKQTGIKCNPHSFRRAWTIESIKQGANLIDVQVLGGWESLEMVRRYARELNAEDALSRYKPLL